MQAFRLAPGISSPKRLHLLFVALFVWEELNEGWVGRDAACPLRVGGHSEPRVPKAQARFGPSSEIPHKGLLCAILPLCPRPKN
jgi:hypothetical protein